MSPSLDRLAFALHRAPWPVADLARYLRDATGRGYGLTRTMLEQRRLVPRPSACRRCLQHMRIPGVWIGESGLCNACLAHEREYSEARAERALAEFLDLPHGDGPDLVMAVSGGKDSTAALVLAVEELGLKPLAFLVRHEFLDDGAEVRARELCRGLGVPFEVYELSLAGDVRRALRSRTLSPWPCLLCCEAQARAALELCDRHGIVRVGTGLRTLWEDRHTAVAPAGFAYRHFRVPPRHDVWIANIIPACRADEDRQRAARDRVGWQDPQIPGNTTNCLLHPVFESLHCRRFGYAWEAERFLSAELRAGCISRASAEQALRSATADLDSELLALVRRRASGG